MEELERGLGTAAGAALWALGTWALVFVVELVWTLRLRRILVADGAPRLGVTFGLVGVLVVALPVVGGYAGCVASAQRSGAEVTEHVGPGVVEEIVDRAVDRAALELFGPDYDDELPLAIDDVLAGARAHRPRAGLVGHLDGIVFEVIAKTTSGIVAPVTWRALVAHARQEITDQVRGQLHRTADDLRSAARVTLLLFLALVLVLDGAAYVLVRRLSGAGSASR